ncbi:transcriptional regulator [Flammeovirga pacifica]|uniref:PAS fold-3 domain-containing protein n=1 Tax=Flammeovirga pacifica TaxID=915059 RepID=A0A1S1YVR2_FLAPC|nr:hypothetical protein [Flammeovirga pacifica]OHX65119.1 hypothetical protein NH26_01495 [Flammeovirga pacifica]
MEKLLLNYFDHSMYGIAVYERICEGKYRFIFYNDAGRKMDGVEGVNYKGKFIEELFPNVLEFGIFDVLEKVYQTEKTQEHKLKSYRHEDGSYMYRTNKIQKLENDWLVCTYHDESKIFDLKDQLDKDYHTFADIQNYSSNKVKGDFSMIHSLLDDTSPLDQYDKIKKIKKHLLNIEDKFDFLTSLVNRGMRKLRNEVF